jgi:hypothetical protein
MRRTDLSTLLALGVIGLSCGQPELRSVTRRQVTIDESVVEADHVRVAFHDVTCPGARTIAVMRGGTEVASCWRGLAVGRTYEDLHVVYRYPLISCGGHDEGDPKSGTGGCSPSGVSYTSSGTPCPPPAR